MAHHALLVNDDDGPFTAGAVGLPNGLIDIGQQRNRKTVLLDEASWEPGSCAGIPTTVASSAAKSSARSRYVQNCLLHTGVLSPGWNNNNTRPPHVFGGVGALRPRDAPDAIGRPSALYSRRPGRANSSAISLAGNWCAK